MNDLHEICELFIDDHSHGKFFFWSAALREAEYLINEDTLNLDEIQEIAIRRIEE